MAYQGKQLQTNKTNLKTNTYRSGASYSRGGGGGGRPPQQPPKPKKKRRRIRWGRILLLLIVLVLVMGTTGAAGYGWYLQRKIADASAQPTQPLNSSGPVNVLLIGLDRDSVGLAARKASMNTDTLILAHVDPSKHTATLVSIPRDTRVQLPTGWDKINAAYPAGGLDELEQSVKSLTGLSVDRYLLLDFPAFRQAVDQLGGVEVNVDAQITDPEGTVHLQPGEQLLNGAQTLAFVRDRSGDNGDTMRVQRQQKVLAALGDKLKSAGVIELLKLVGAASDTLQTNLTISEMSTLATAVEGQDAKVADAILPGDPLDLYGVHYWQVNTDSLQQWVAGLDDGAAAGDSASN